MATINANELSLWTPFDIDLDSSSPSLVWGNFGSRRFLEPFFDDTVGIWACSEPPPRIVTTGLEALALLDNAPSLSPSGLIFHISRCGSTLLARLLRCIRGCIVISEPNIVNSILLADRSRISEETQAELLRFVIRALGRCRFD